MSLLKHFRNLRRKDSEKEPDEKVEGQAAGWLWGNYRLLKYHINMQLAFLMALAELSQRKSELLPKLSKAVLTRCPSIVELLLAAATEDPATFERNRYTPFGDTPPHNLRQKAWLWGNYQLLKFEINKQLAIVMALAELSQRKSEYLPKLSQAVLTRCASIVKLLLAAATEDPATFERNNNPPFTDTPPRFSNYDDAILFWTCWLGSIEKYPYRIPVPNHLSEAHKWFWLTRDIDEGTGSSLLSRLEALIPFGQLDDIRLRSTEFTKDFHATHPSA